MNDTTLLVSFCNRSDTTGKVLAAVDANSGGVRRWLDLREHTPVSACGIAYAGGTLYCACSDSEHSYIAVFDNDLQLRDYLTLTGVADVHSICTDGSSIFAASTGTDEVVQLEIGDLSRPAQVVWHASSERRDVNHVNSVAFAQGRLLCGGFGGKGGGAWSDAYDGFFYDIAAREYVIRGLYHPHSLVEYGGSIYFCESAESSVRTLTNTLRYVDGYSRGLAINDGIFFAGASRGRRSKALARYVLNPADAGVRAGRCGVYVGRFDKPSQSRVIDLSRFGDEIYDVCLLPEAMYAAI